MKIFVSVFFVFSISGSFLFYSKTVEAATTTPTALWNITNDGTGHVTEITNTYPAGNINGSPTPITGPNSSGAALAFTSSSAINLGNNFQFGNSDFTIATWLKTNSSATAVAVGEYDGSGHNIWCGFLSGSATCSATGSIGTHTLSMSGYADGGWHLFGIIRRGTTLYFSIDGVDATSTAVTSGETFNPGGYLYLNQFGSNGILPGTFSLYETGVWNGVGLLANEMAAKYATPSTLWGNGGPLTAGTISLTNRASTTLDLISTVATNGTSPYTYQWYRSTNVGFTPGVGNILSGQTSLALSDTGLASSTTYYYKIRATDNTASTTDSAAFSATTVGGTGIYYYNNFDSETLGALPSGWINISPATWQTGTTGAISASKSLTDPTFHVGAIAIYTGTSSVRDSVGQISQIVNLDGSSVGANGGLFLRVSSDGNDGYLFAPDFSTIEPNAQTISIYKKVSGSYSLVNKTSMSRIWSNADIAIIKAEVLGTTLRWKVWKSTETEPVSWTYSTTDSSITSPGYIGLYEGWNNGGAASSVSAIDDMYWGVTGTSFATTSVVNNDVIPVNNSAWIAGLSPYTWYTFGSSYILADNPGAYFKVKFTGTSVSLGVDVSAMSGISLPAKQYPRIAYQIDGGTWQTYQLKSTDSLVSLGSSLSDTTHDLEVLYLSSDAYTARWNGTMSLKITNLTLDVGKTLSAATLLPKKMLIFGDSITEGAWVLGDHTDLTNYSNYEVATSSYAVGVANDLNAEYGNAAFGGEAWGSSFNSDIPQFTSAWNYYFSTNSRLSGGLLSPAPDYVLINMGANGGLSSGSVASSLLSSLRVATGSSTKIFIMVPFNGTGRTNITSGFNSYQTSFSDSNTFLIDLGSAGATYADTISTYSFDGLHPNLAGHAQLRTITSAAIQNAIQNIPTLPTVSTPSTSNILLDGVILNSAISSDGNASSTIEGFNYGTTAAYGSVASSTGTFGIGSFSQNISGLVCGTAYHFQAFATNSIGTGTSSDQTFNTNVCVIASIPAVVSSNQTSSSGGSAYSQINNLLAMGNYALAQQIAKQYGLSIPTQNIPRNVALDAPSAGGQQFTRTLRVGATSSDVKKLQIFLNAQGFTVAKKGAGSPGHETTTFGPATKAALMKFQSAHKKETLDPQGLKAPTGFFGIDTKKAVNALVK